MKYEHLTWVYEKNWCNLGKERCGVNLGLTLVNITVLGLLANPDVNLKWMHQLHNVRFLLQKHTLIWEVSCRYGMFMIWWTLLVQFKVSDLLTLNWTNDVHHFICHSLRTELIAVIFSWKSEEKTYLLNKLTSEKTILSSKRTIFWLVLS